MRVNLHSVFDGAFQDINIKTVSKQVVNVHQREIRLCKECGTPMNPSCNITHKDNSTWYYTKVWCICGIGLVQTNWMGWCLMEEEMVPSLTWPCIFGFGSVIAVLIRRYCERFIGSLTSKEKHEEVCHLLSKGWTTHLVSGVIILVHQCCFCTIQKANVKCLHLTGLNQKQKKIMQVSFL